MRSQYPRRGRRYSTILVAAALLGVCGGGADSLPAQSELLDTNKEAFPVAPAAGTGTLALPVRDALASVVPSLQQQRFPSDAVRTIGISGDGRLLWYLNDLQRFATHASQSIVVDAFEELSSAELPGEPSTAMGDRVLAWDLPAPPNYRLLKRDLFLLIEPRWAPFFDDEGSAIDWRLVGWGCTAPGFLDSGLTVFASTLPRPARRGRVAPGRGFDSRISPASTVRCMSA